MPTLSEQPIHLGRGGSAVEQSPITGPEWFADYGERHAADGADGRLVSQYDFDENWDTWEVHPQGAEVVLCLKGVLTLIQSDHAGAERRLVLAAGDYAINPPGVWHTADVLPDQRATCIFITSGEGTLHRPR